MSFTLGATIMSRLSGMTVLAFAMAVVSSAARADLIKYTAVLNGPSESPPNASPGTGFAEVDVDTVAQTMHVHATFSGLLGPTTASHIHAATAVPGTGTAGVATQTPSFIGFPLGVTSGTFDNTLDLTQASSYNPAFVTATGGTVAGAEAALLASLAAGTAYYNIHSTVDPGGEIRGFLTVPEPSVLTLACTAALGFFGYRRLVRRRTAS
jgi:hypothetical protein